MRWTVRIDPALARKMRIWFRRYPALAALLNQRFENELAVDPEAHLGPWMVPTTDRSYHIDFMGCEGVPDGLHVWFAVRLTPASHTVDVLAGRFTSPGSPHP